MKDRLSKSINNQYEHGTNVLSRIDNIVNGIDEQIRVLNPHINKTIGRAKEIARGEIYKNFI